MSRQSVICIMKTYNHIYRRVNSWIFNVALVYYVKRTNHMCTKSQYIRSKTNKQEIIILQVSYLLAYISAFKVA